MNDLIGLAAAACAGMVLGGAFFAGLWWTVQRGIGTRRPALWFFCSLVLRTSLAAAGFYLVGRGGWERLAACLAGFVLVRSVFTARAREAARHAP